MQLVDALLDSAQGALALNPSTLAGAIDVVVVRDCSGQVVKTMSSSPWHVRFGKREHVLSPAEKEVDLVVNGVPASHCVMRLDATGKAFFVHRVGTVEVDCVTGNARVEHELGGSVDRRRTNKQQHERQHQQQQQQQVATTASTAAQVVQTGFELPKNSGSQVNSYQNSSATIGFAAAARTTTTTTTTTTTNAQSGDELTTTTTTTAATTATTAAIATAASATDGVCHDRDRTTTITTAQGPVRTAAVLEISANDERAQAETAANNVRFNPEKAPCPTIVDNGTLQRVQQEEFARSVAVKLEQLAASQDVSEVEKFCPVLPAAVEPEARPASRGLVSSLFRIFSGNRANAASPIVAAPAVARRSEDFPDQESDLMHDGSYTAAERPAKPKAPPVTPHRNSVRLADAVDNDRSCMEERQLCIPVSGLHDAQDRTLQRFVDGRMLASSRCARHPLFIDYFSARERPSTSPELDDAFATHHLRDDEAVRLTPHEMAELVFRIYNASDTSWFYVSFDMASPMLVSMACFNLAFIPNRLSEWDTERRAALASTVVLEDRKRSWKNWLLGDSPSAGNDPVHLISREPVDRQAGASNTSRTPSSPVLASGMTSPGSVHVLRRSLVPTQQELEGMNLRWGENDLTFILRSELQGEKRIHCRLFCWPPETKIVVSDVDGTITRSDILGHLLPVLKIDWSHSGVAELYSNVARNGYQLLYLTSRPIGAANRTRSYVRSLEQREESTIGPNTVLPAGPLLLNPAGMWESFDQEIVTRRPQDFKITCLENIKSLFGFDSRSVLAPTCFAAGFGNRATDSFSYRRVGIPDSHIFVINPRGEIQISLADEADNRVIADDPTVAVPLRTYSSLNELVHSLFPPLPKIDLPELPSVQPPEIDRICGVPVPSTRSLSNSAQRSINSSTQDWNIPAEWFAAGAPAEIGSLPS